MSTRHYLRLLYPEDPHTLTAKAIRRVTMGPPHVAVEITTVEDCELVDVSYYESICKTDDTTHKSGVRGPIPKARLADWLNQGHGRTCRTQPDKGYLPPTQEEAAEAIDRLAAATSTVYYAPVQIIQNWLASRLKLRISIGAGSVMRWTCCETMIRARVIPPRYWDMLNLDSIGADDTWPGGPSVYSLSAGVDRILAEYGAIHPVIRMGHREGGDI